MSIATISAEARLADDGYSIEAVFIPWTSSRGYAPEKKKVTQRSLNWNITLKRHGKPIVTALYSAGIAHCPSYPKSSSYGGLSVDAAKAIEYETQSGYRYGTREKILPKLYDVVASLLLDARVSEYPDFESWADDMGLDTDSRSAERSYRECRRIAEQFTARVGLEEMARLREIVGEW